MTVGFLNWTFSGKYQREVNQGWLGVTEGGQGAQVSFWKQALGSEGFPKPWFSWCYTSRTRCNVWGVPWWSAPQSGSWWAVTAQKHLALTPERRWILLSPQVINPCSVCCSRSHLLYRAGDFSLPQIRICLFLGLPSIKLTFPFLCASVKDVALLSCRQRLKCWIHKAVFAQISFSFSRDKGGSWCLCSCSPVLTLCPWCFVLCEKSQGRSHKIW